MTVTTLQLAFHKCMSLELVLQTVRNTLSKMEVSPMSNSSPLTVDAKLDNVSDDSGSSDFSDFDLSLLDNADGIMKSISPMKYKTCDKKMKVDTKDKDKAKVTQTSFKSKSQLTKCEIAHVIDHLNSQRDNLIDNTIEGVRNEQFWISHEGYKDHLEECVSKEQFKQFVTHVYCEYTNIYLESSKGHTKYSDFQLQWFQNSSKYLFRRNTQSEYEHMLADLFDSIKSNDKNHFVSCTVSTVHRHMFDQCSKQIVKLLESPKPNTGRAKPKEKTPDKDYQLFRINGWVLREIIKHTSKKCTGLTESEILEWDSCVSKLKSDKSDLPLELKHLDKGLYDGMVFPKATMLSFMRKSDLIFKDVTSEDSQQKFGNEVASVAKVTMKCHKELKMCFAEQLQWHNTATIEEDLVNKMYNVWMEKYVNARIKDTIIVAEDKLEMDKAKRTTTKTQNLRDQLLTYHIKPQKQV